MADYDISAKITADSKGYTSGIDKAKKSTLSFSKGLKDTLTTVTGVSLSLAGAVKVVKEVTKYINESTQAYKAEALSLKALETAVNNNPFTNGESIKGLKDFASEIQRTTNYGDDYLFPFMQQLISSGRTQAETMKIIKTATDIASSGAMSFETAIQQLNATMNGNIGRLGQQNAELKLLTEEQLRSGEAVEILGEKYKGLAEATADTSKQLANMKGDFAEAVGSFTADTSDYFNKMWIEFYKNGIEALNKFDAYLDREIIGKKVAEQFYLGLESAWSSGDLKNSIRYLRDVLPTITEKELHSLQAYLSSIKEIDEEGAFVLEKVNAEIERRKDLANIEEENAIAKNKRAKEEADILDQILRKKEEDAKKEKEDADNVAKAKEELRKHEENNIARMHELDVERERQLAEIIKQELEDLKKIENAQKSYDEAEGLENKINALENLIQATEEAGLSTDKLNKKLKLLKTLLLMRGVVKVFTNSINGIIKGFKKMLSVAKSVFDTFNKIISFNISDALDKVLKFEDNLMTFFVNFSSTLPQFVLSVLQSLVTTLTNVDRYLTKDNIKTAVLNILTMISDNLPTILKSAASILGNLITGIIEGLIDWTKNGGLQTIFKALLDLQDDLQDILGQLLEGLAEFLKNSMPQIFEFLKNSIISASKKLAEYIPFIVDIIIELVKIIIKIITDKDIMKSSIDVIKSLLRSILEQIIPAIIEIITSENLFDMFTLGLKIGLDIVEGIIEAILDVDWGSVFGSIGNVSTSGSVWGGIGNVLLGGLPGLFDWWASGTNNAPSGLSIVGEKGPELVDLHGGERIYNAQKTKALLSGASSGNTMNVTFNNLQDTTASAMMSQLRYYNRQLAVNGF